MEEECIRILQELTGKKHIVFVQRGNEAIRLALKLAKELGYKIVLLQDQGGWLTYEQFCEKEKLECSIIKTSQGIFALSTVKDYSGCVLLINSMPGYAALQGMREVTRICMKQKNFIINDASGSIGTEEAKYGDIVLGSFAHDKPVNIKGHGGFMATDSEEYFDFLKKNNAECEIDFSELLDKLKGLNERLVSLKAIRDNLITELECSEFTDKVIHKDRKNHGDGINVIVRFDTTKEKEKLIKLAEKENLEFTLCPRDIRVNEKAVSFEIKRR